MRGDVINMSNQPSSWTKIILSRGTWVRPILATVCRGRRSSLILTIRDGRVAWWIWIGLQSRVELLAPLQLLFFVYEVN